MSETLFFWIKAFVLVLLGIVFWLLALVFVSFVTRLGMLVILPINFLWRQIHGEL